MKLYLIRHGETIENLKKIVMGHKHGRLSPLGRQQARKLGRILKAHKFDAIYSSDLRRAADTAKEIASYHPQEIIYSKDLRESHFGNLEGKPRERAEIIFSKLPGAFMTKKAEGGESPADLRKRVKRFINHLHTKHKDDTVLIVTHNGVIKIFLSILKKIPIKKIFESTEIKNAQGYLIDFKTDRKTKVSRLTL